MKFLIRIFAFRNMIVALFLTILGTIYVTLPKFGAHVQSLIVDAYEMQAAREEQRAYQAAYMTQLDQFAAWVKPWFANPASVAPLMKENPDYAAYERSLFSLGNHTSAKFRTTDIRLYNSEGQKLASYSTGVKDETFSKSEDKLVELVKKCAQSETIDHTVVFSDTGDPYSFSVIPVEDRDGQIAFFNVINFDIGLVVDDLSKSTGYFNQIIFPPNSIVKGRAQAEFAAPFKKDGRNYVTKEDKLYLIREFELPDSLFTRSAKAQVFVEQTEMMASIESGLAEIRQIIMWALPTGGIVLIVLLMLAMSPLNRSVGKLREAVTRTSDGSRSLSATSTQIAAATQEQTAAMQETMATLTQIKATLQKNALDSKNALGVSRTSKEVAVVGRRTVGEAIGAISDVSDNIRELLDAMNRTKDQVSSIRQVISQIGEKTVVINDIAFKTQLLSFNASIEAARAGVHGRGFSVVAEEIGKLANVSSSAAQEINDIITTSLKLVQESVNAANQEALKLTDTGKTSIEKASRITLACGNSLEQIVENVGAVDSNMENIAQASQEQLQAIDSIVDAITDLNQTIVQSHQSSLETATQANALAIASNQLSDISNLLQAYFLGKGLRREAAPSRSKMMVGAQPSAVKTGKPALAARSQNHDELNAEDFKAGAHRSGPLGERKIS